MLEGAQLGPGVDAERVGERVAGAAQGREGVALALRAVEGEGQQPPALLPERLFGDERLELGDEQRGLAEVQPRAEQALAGDRAQPGQARDLRLRPRLVGVLGVRGPAPQVQRAVERVDGLGRGELGGRLDDMLEAPGVDGVGRDAQCVPHADAHDDAPAGARAGVGLEAPAQVADVGLQDAGGVRGGAGVPEAVDDPVGRDDLPAGQDEDGEHRALASPAQRELDAVQRRADLAEDVQPQVVGVAHRCLPSAGVGSNLRSRAGAREGAARGPPGGPAEGPGQAAALPDRACRWAAGLSPPRAGPAATRAGPSGRAGRRW